MKSGILSAISVLLLVMFNGEVQAQKASLHDIDATGDTTISIQKGASNKKSEHYEIVDAKAEIVGDANVLEKEARAEWKKACDSWKQDIKDLNKANQVLAVSCNSPTCSTETTGTTCRSVGTYKIKTLMSKSGDE